MRRNHDMRRTTVAISLVVLLSGCQTVPLSETAAPLDNVTFMRAWDIYRHCQVSRDVEVMRADLKQLIQAATVQASATDKSLLLPDFFSRIIAKPVQRLAVDPKAMAASCALSTGQAALREERIDLAIELFRTVLSNHAQPEYAFYRDQARTGLLEAERLIQFAGRVGDIAPTVIHLAAPSPAPPTDILVSFED